MMEAHDDELARLRRRLTRERAARREAEAIAERSSLQLYERHREVELLATVAGAANRSRTPDEALRSVLPALCRHLSWLVAQAWIRDARDGRLRCSPIHHAEDDSRFGAFVRHSQALRLGDGEGLPGRVFSGGEAVWIPDVTIDANFPRAGLADAAGLHAAVAFPVVLDGEVVAALECFADVEIELTPDLMRIVNGLGESLAQVFERERGERRLRHEARHDALTGLPNRIALRERLEQMLALAGRADLGLAVGVLDLDRFKEVNDTLGHEHGDRLLVEVGRRIAGVLGSSDTVARLGGDEFALILPRVRSERDAGAVAARLAAALREPVGLDGVSVAVDASLGLALHPAHGDDPSELMRHADVAMYVAKRGHLGHVVYSASANPNNVCQLGLISDLREAVESAGLAVHYQPKIDIESRRLAGVEALVRWEHPTRGMVSPVEFIPLAERTGLIRPLTRLVLRRALRQVRAWLDGGLQIPVAVNISPRTLLEERFPAQVAQALGETGAPAHLLELEVTEGSMLEDPERAREALVALRELGVSIAIDDFGTGFSSLAQLKVLPVGCLKIDRSFVAAMTRDDRDGFIVRAAVRLGHDLGMQIVAEGVEDEGTLAALRELRCDTAQGYLFHRPADPATLEGWLRAASAAPDELRGEPEPVAAG